MLPLLLPPASEPPLRFTQVLGGVKLAVRCKYTFCEPPHDRNTSVLLVRVTLKVNGMGVTLAQPPSTRTVSTKMAPGPSETDPWRKTIWLTPTSGFNPVLAVRSGGGALAAP